MEDARAALRYVDVEARRHDRAVRNSTVHRYRDRAVRRPQERHLGELRRLKEAKSLLRKTIPVARRVLGVNNDLTLRMRWCYAIVLYDDAAATLDDLRESVTTLEDTERTARRVFGGAHPLTGNIRETLQTARAALRARETPSSSSGSA